MPTMSGIHYSLNDQTEIRTAPPLILIHGAGGNLLNWHPYVRRIAGCRVYALDLPGHGNSQSPGRQTIADYARDILAFMDDVQIHEAVVAGFSMGSAVALTLVIHHPERFVGLALLGGGAKMPVSPTFLNTAGDPATFESAVDTITKYSFTPQASQDLLHLSKQNMMKVSPDVLLGDFLACNQFDVTDELSRITLPTLILCGAEDVMTPPKFSRFLHEQIPNSSLHILKQAGHMITLEQPREVADLMSQFMDGLLPQT